MEAGCGTLLTELQSIWAEIGESEEHKKQKLSEIQRECMVLYQTEIDEANKIKAELYQSVKAKESELATLVASLGENVIHSKEERKKESLKDQLSSLVPLLEDLRTERDERIKQFSEIRSQIRNLTAEITGCNHEDDTLTIPIDGQDLSLERLNQYQAQLRALQKEKSDRLHMVLKYVNEVQRLCGVLGKDYRKTVDQVHPSLHKSDSGQPINIADTSLEGLAHEVLKLKREKKVRTEKLRKTVDSLFELWDVIGTPDEERMKFKGLFAILRSTEITCSGVLSEETIKEAEDEVERLVKLKNSRLKVLVMERRIELEQICRKAHIELDISTEPEKTDALIDSGLVDASDILVDIEGQIEKAKEEVASRKEIMDKINKWVAACEEENWLEQYNQDENRYNAGKGTHLNLKRAEKARITVTKIPAMVDNLISRAILWENERNRPFLYDGVRLLFVLEQYILARKRKEKEKRLNREQRKQRALVLTEKQIILGSKQSPKRNISFSTRSNGYLNSVEQRISIGCTTPDLLMPKSYSNLSGNDYFKETTRSSARSLDLGK